MKVHIGLGGNLGKVRDAFAESLRLLEERGLGRLTAVSSLYKTEPYGIKQQPWFLNAAAEVETELDPEEFRRALEQIERDLGRPRQRIKNGPRPIDLDVLLCEDRIINTPELIVPHPRMHERPFVLVPLAEIAPSAVHPVLKKTVAELLHACENCQQVRAAGRL